MRPELDQLADPPFQLQVRKATDQDVERINQREGYTYSRKLEPAEQAIQRAQSARSATRDRLLSWIYHPDQRVPLAMIDNRPGSRGQGQQEVWREEAEFVAEHLLRRSWIEARSEGVIWTPLLDKMSTRAASLWPKALSMTDEEYQDRNHPIRQGPLGNPQKQFRKLIPWLQQNPPAKTALKLYEFQEEKVGRLVGQVLPDPSPELIQRALEKDFERGRWFVENNDLTQSGRAVLAQKGLEVATMEEWEWNQPHPITAVSLFRRLGQQEEWEGDRELQERLYKRIIQTERGEPLDQSAEACLQILEHVGTKHLQLPQLKTLYRYIQDDSDQVIGLLRSCWGREDFWSFVAEDSSLFAVRDWLSQSHSGRSIQRVRKVLQESRSGTVLQRLLEDSQNSQEQRKLFERIQKYHPQRAVQLMEELGTEKLEALGPKQLARLLSIEDPDLRQKALRAISRNDTPGTPSSQSR